MTLAVLALAQGSDAAVPGIAEAIRGMAAVIIVLLLIAAAAWLLRRSPLALRGGARGPVRVETAVPLGDRRSLLIVEVEGRRLLLGLTPVQVSLVTELGPPGAGTQKPDTRHQTPDAGFGRTLDRSLSDPHRGQP